MAALLEQDITGSGMNQGDLVKVLENLRDQVNALTADITAVRAAVTGITAQLDADAGVTDTDYASGNDPAAITATTTITLSKG